MLRRCVIAIPSAILYQHRGTGYESHRLCQYYNNYQRREALSLYSSILNMFTRRKEKEQLIDADKLKALDDLKAALTVLSVASDEEPSIFYDHDQLIELSAKPIEALTTNELEELGRAYFDGIDSVIEVNLERAFILWSEAADRGSEDSKYMRAVCLRDGSGVARDLERAFQEMLSVADDHSYALAQYAAAVMLSHGEGTVRDDVRAFEYFQKAALKGVAPALYNLGNAYASGTGVQVDISKAIHFYEAAIKAGDPTSKFTYGTWLYKGIHGVAVDKTRSFQLQLEAADAGHPYAMFNTGAAYMEGVAVTQDFQTAAVWFEKAADKGIIEANLNLGTLHRTGMGVPRNLHKAVEIFARFADQHELSAQIVEQVKEEIKAEEQR